MKRNLIVSRSGDNSLHLNWLKGPTADFDLVVTYYGDNIPKNWENDCNNYEIQRIKGGKWRGLYEYLTKSNDWRKYEYIMLPDDDLLCSAADLNTIFNYAHNLKADLCQPSLDRNSYFSHLITLKHDSFRYRMTNFVELMIPCFSTRMLDATLQYFDITNSGWGLDNYWWEIICKNNFNSPFIIDDVAITHTRPVGSAGNGIGKAGISAHEELEYFCKKLNFKRPPLYNIGGKIRFPEKFILESNELNYYLIKDVLSMTTRVNQDIILSYIITHHELNKSLEKNKIIKDNVKENLLENIISNNKISAEII